MSTDLQLYRVLVTQKWSAEGTALVWAPDRATAQKWAEVKVDIDIMDAEKDNTQSYAHLEPIDDGVMKRMANWDLWLIMDGNTVDLDEFRAMLDPERIEAMRFARIERNNGQLPLLDVA